MSVKISMLALWVVTPCVLVHIDVSEEHTASAHLQFHTALQPKKKKTSVDIMTRMFDGISACSKDLDVC